MTTLDDVAERAISSMEEKVKSLPDSSSIKCCIYRIPDIIKKGRVEYYQPSIVSIGPLYGSVEYIQKLKLTYLRYFLQHPLNANPSLKQYSYFVRDNLTAIGECYNFPQNSVIEGIIEPIVVDVAFIVYLLIIISNSDMISSSIPIPIQQQGLMPYMTKDLFLLENQIPFFVLLKFFDMAFGHAHPPTTFIHMILNTISFTTVPGYKAARNLVDKNNNINNNNNNTDPSSIKHLLDLLWICCCFHSSYFPVQVQTIINLPGDENEPICSGYPTYPKTAKKLSDNGVKFEVSDSAIPLHLQTTFMDGKFVIPELVLDNDSETYFRNLLYFEQCSYSASPYINDYLLFFDKLIDTVEDVQVLQEAGVLINNLGSDKNAVRFFNNVPRNTVRRQFYYSKVSEDANAFANNSWNQSMSLLKRRYFGHPWAAISVIAAILLFILTLLQTIASFTK